jgi:hypothetical protein
MAEKGPAARVALIGVQGSGKSSLFCALTGMEYARVLANVGKVTSAAVRVLDPRIQWAHDKNGPHKKLVAPTLEFMDTPPIGIEGAAKQDNPGVFAMFRDADGFIAVLKAYDLEGDKAAQVKKQWEAIQAELYLTDVDIMQKKVDKLRVEAKKGALPNIEEIRKELAVLERLLDAVAGGNTKVFAELKEEDEKKLRGFQFFSRKPLIPIVNMSENDLAKPPTPTAESIAVAAKLEQELLAMEEGERASFMKDYGLERLVTPTLVVDLYAKLGFQTFLTLGDKDTTGWALRKGASAFEAAGKIHTDIQKGFINCEIVSWDDYKAFGDAHKAAASGKQKVVGKDHKLADFDVINIKTSAR